MGKFKEANCFYCGEKITRHDEKRERVQAGENAYKLAHLSCLQKNEEEGNVAKNKELR